MPKTLPLTRAFAFAAKAQAARGVDAAPTMAANAIRLASSFDVRESWLSDNLADGEQTGGKGTYPPGEKAGRVYTFPIRRRMRGPGVAYSAAALPAEDALLMALLGVRTDDFTLGTESVEYSGTDGAEALLSVLAQDMGQQFKATDCVPVSASIQWEAGKFLDLIVELEGVGSAPTQQALEAATLDTIKPPIFRGGVFSLGGVALAPIKGTLDFGIEKSDPTLDGTAGDAWEGYRITDRTPKGTMEVQVVDLATFDPYALAAAGTTMPWIYDLGDEQYRNVRIEADRLSIMKVTPVNRGGVKAWSFEYMIHRAIAPSTKDPVIKYN